MRLYSKKKSAFSLLEILVVVLIIGVLFVLLTPKINNSLSKSRESAVMNRFNEFKNAATLVLTENAGINSVTSPGTETESMVKLLNAHLDPAIQFDTATIQGEYCDSVAKDPWNNHYRVHIYENTVTFISYGKNNVTLHAAEFDYASEDCDYILEVRYINGKVDYKTEGFTKNIEKTLNKDGISVEWDRETPDDLFIWSGTTITGLTDSGKQLTRIVIPEKCTRIAHRAFDSCTNITSIKIPDSVTNIEWEAFYGCTGLRQVTIPEGVTAITGGLFKECSGLEEVTIPSSVRTIEKGAFMSCSSLKSLNIPEGVRSIGRYVFQGCQNLKTVTLPSSLTSIDEFAFYSCRGIQSIEIPNGVTDIRNHAFSCCINIESISLPSSITSIGERAFEANYALRSVEIPEGVTEICNGAFYECVNLRDVSLPNSLVTIGASTFNRCSNLTNIRIPNSVTSIGNNAFWRNTTVHYSGDASGAPWGANRVISD